MPSAFPVTRDSDAVPSRKAWCTREMDLFSRHCVFQNNVSKKGAISIKHYFLGTMPTTLCTLSGFITFHEIGILSPFC